MWSTDKSLVDKWDVFHVCWSRLFWHLKISPITMNKGQRVRILVSAVCCFSICVMMNWFWSPCSPSVSVIHNCCPAISDSRVLQKSHAVEGGGQGRCFIFMFFQGLIVLKATSELLKPQIQQLFMSLTRADQIVLKPYLSYVLDMEDHIQICVTRQTSP